MAVVLPDGTELTDAEYQEYAKQKRAREDAEYKAKIAARKQAENEAQRMLGELGQAYTTYTSFLKDNPELCLRLDGEQELHHQVYKKLLENLERADEAPRCGYIKVNGVPCGSPRMKGQELVTRTSGCRQCDRRSSICRRWKTPTRSSWG